MTNPYPILLIHRIVIVAKTIAAFLIWVERIDCLWQTVTGRTASGHSACFRWRLIRSRYL